MPRFWIVLGLILLCQGAVGCQGSSSTDPNTTGKTDAAADVEPASEKKSSEPPGTLPQLPQAADVQGWEGNWALVPTLQRQDLYFSLLRLSQDDAGHWKAEILSPPPPPGKIEVSELKIDGQHIHIDGVLEVPQKQGPPQRFPWDFDGDRQEGEVRGSMLLSWTNGMVPARIVPTDSETLQGYAPAVTTAGSDELEKVLQEPDPARGLWKVAKAYRNSPLSLEAYNAVLGQVAQSRWVLSPEELHDLAADFQSSAKLWGSRLSSLSILTAGARLSQSRKSLDLSEELLNAGESALPEKTAPAESLLKTARLNLRAARDLAGLEAESADTAAAAYADLQEVANERRDQLQYAELVLALAEYAQKTKQIDAAIGYYTTLVSLPVMEQLALSSRVGVPADSATPRKALEALWQEKHGSQDGLEAALAENYDRQVAEEFAKIKDKLPPVPPEDAGNHTVLVELFTNVGCNPCVAADLAAEAISASLPKTEAIVLQYHVHDPAPDPLTSMDGEGRATSYYKIEGRPACYVDGRPIPNLGGVFISSMLETAYRGLRFPIDHFLKTSTDITIDAQADVVDGKLSVKVSVNGLTEEQLSACRLRLAIAEENVEYNFSNGIRHHSMVVRTLLGGASGIAAKQGALKYSLEMPLAELKSRQLGYLASYAHGRRISFDQAPVELKPLWLVAFVQNDANHEVLQSAAVSVQGDLVYPEMNLSDLMKSISTGQKTQGAGKEPQTERAEQN